MAKNRPTSELTHRTVEGPAGRIHLVEQGSGPLVLLLHGFPESWYSWRHQLPVLADAGYRAVAIDVRGYGRSSKPAEIGAYRMTELVADNLAVVKALGEKSAIVVGHDWGSAVAANSAILHPEVFRAAALLSVPFAPAGGPRPSEMLAHMAPPELGEHYMSYFQEPGRAESEIEPDVRGWLAGFFAALAADTQPGPDQAPPQFIAPGTAMRDRFPAARPEFLTDEVLDHYVGEFERTGLTGGLNRYRNMDRDWEDLTEVHGAPLTVPSLFIGGALDAVVRMLGRAIDAFPHTMPALHGSHVLDGAGHWIQQERPDEVNKLLVAWLGALNA
ncbi:alpha/beta fold hydrolase [Streptomyces sp. NPDC059443]|uniref:alpha/beta fold hydrolase n=1 Tax=unclassified Streptomyces TaxID=2593676 RepID=UPI0036B91849